MTEPRKPAQSKPEYFAVPEGYYEWPEEKQRAWISEVVRRLGASRKTADDATDGAT